MSDGGGNQPNYAVELALLKREISRLDKDFEEFRDGQEKLFDRRTAHVNSEFVNLKKWIKDEFVPLNSYRPLVKWLTIVGISVISLISTVVAAMITFVFSYFTKGGGSGGPE